MKYQFKDTADDIWFEFHDTLPENKNEYKIKVNIAALTLFGLYRKSIYRSYGSKLNLAQDIKEFNLNPAHIANKKVIDPKDSLNNYAIYSCLLGIKEITERKAKCYVAYKKDSHNWPNKVGFASFYEATINGKPVVYISSASVSTDYVSKSIARRLMECILAHYPQNTEFYILTRIFNTEAITLYRERLKFEPITIEEVNQLEYDERYVGFKRKMTQEELIEINNKREDISISPRKENHWKGILEKKREILTKYPMSHKIMLSQFNSFIENNAPKIVAPEIKCIPIEESDEDLVDIVKMNHPRIKMLPAPSSPFEAPDKSSGFPCSSKIRKNLFEKLKIMLEEIDILSNAFNYESGQISIRVFEGLRDLETQRMLFENKQREIGTEHPDWDSNQIFVETTKWVSPVIDNVPVHSTGGAIDIRLWDDINKTFLDMGPFGIIWGSNPSAPTFSEAINVVQKNNRLLALTAATNAGLTNYIYEYWHFSYKDKYAAYWRENNEYERKSAYGMK